MARLKRRTNADWEQERAAAEQRAWEEFLPTPAALQTFVDAQLLVAQAPPPNAPGRRYYSNLGFFLGAFTVPMGSNHAEGSHYIELIKRLDAASSLKPDAAEGILAALRSSMTQHQYA